MSVMHSQPPGTGRFFRRLNNRLVPILDLYSDLTECRFRIVFCTSLQFSGCPLSAGSRS